MESVLTLDLKNGELKTTADGREIQTTPDELVSVLQQQLLQAGNPTQEQMMTLFQLLVGNLARQKNIVYGDITNVQHVRIGDVINFYFKQAELPKVLTQLIPRFSPDELVGREDLLQQIFDYAAQRKRVLICGLGGIGKTTLAASYVANYYDRYGHIVWVQQQSDNFVNDFIGADGLLGSLNIHADKLTLEQVFETVLRKLKSAEKKPSLLVIDNATSAMNKHLGVLPFPPDWHIVVTSREELPGFTPLRLGLLNPADALLLFKKYNTNGQFSDDQVRELLGSIDYHTLSIEIFAKSAQHSRYDLSTLKQAYETDLRVSIEKEVNHEFVENDNAGAFLSSLFDLSSLTDGLLLVLRQFAALPGRYHRFSLILELFQPADEAARITLSEALSTLQRLGWLLYDPAADAFKMHRIIAAVVKRKKRASLDELAGLLQAITNKLRPASNERSPAERFQWIEFGESMRGAFEPPVNHAFIYFMHAFALVQQDAGSYVFAEHFLLNILDYYEDNFGLTDKRSRQAFYDIGRLYREMGEPQKAFAYAKDCVALSAASGQFDEQVPVYYNLYALLLQDLGQYKEAAEIYGIASQCYTGRPEQELMQTTLLSDLGLLRLKMGDYAGAKSVLLQAEAIERKYHDGEYPGQSTLLANLGAVALETGEFAEANAYLEQALALDEKNYGADHPETAKSQAQLAMVYLQLGKAPFALNLLLKSVRTHETSFGENNPETAVVYQMLSVCLKSLGVYGAAEKLLRKSYQIGKDSLGDDPHRTGKFMLDLADLSYLQYDMIAARDLCEKGLASLKSVLPAEHPLIGEGERLLDIVLREGGFK